MFLKSWSESFSYLHPQSVNTVVLHHYSTRVELSKSSQDVSLSHTHVPELASYLSCPFLPLPDLAYHQYKASISIEPIYHKLYLFAFFPPKI